MTIKRFHLSVIIILCMNLLTSCNGTIKTSNTVGDWYHEVSRTMGGYKISMNSELTIIRVEAGVYRYKLTQTTTDQMYGGKPKSESSSGKFEEYISDNKWIFTGGKFGNSGGYILVPDDQWDDYKPNTITIRFPVGRGNSMTFYR